MQRHCGGYVKEGGGRGGKGHFQDFWVKLKPTLKWWELTYRGRHSSSLCHASLVLLLLLGCDKSSHRHGWWGRLHHDGWVLLDQAQDRIHRGRRVWPLLVGRCRCWHSLWRQAERLLACWDEVIGISWWNHCMFHGVLTVTTAFVANLRISHPGQQPYEDNVSNLNRNFCF